MEFKFHYTETCDICGIKGEIKDRFNICRRVIAELRNCEKCEKSWINKIKDPRGYMQEELDEDEE